MPTPPASNRARTPARAGRTALALMALLVLAGLVSAPAHAGKAPVPPTTTLRDNRANASGTWVLAQTASVGHLRSMRPQLDAALKTPKVRGFSQRVAWNAVDTDFALLEEGLAIARANRVAYTVRVMAGKATPQRVFTAGAAYYVEDGKKVPMPFKANGAPNIVFEREYAAMVQRLAAWAKRNNVRLLHLSWYGDDWSELNLSEQVQRAPGYTYQRWLQAHARLADVGYAVSGDKLTIEYPTSGGGVPTMFGDIADMFVQRYGRFNPRVVLQGNFWKEGAPGGPMFSRPLFHAQQAAHGSDNNWPLMYGYLRDNYSLYAEVYLSSFSAPQTKAALRTEIAKFADHWSRQLTAQR